MAKKIFDYIIVGGGSAGSVLANRLSADPNNEVLVLEAGHPDYKLDFRIHMPAALTYPLTSKTYNWWYESDPEPFMNNRRIYQPRGKVLGGSSCINGMIYIRGNANDYEKWGLEMNVPPLSERICSFKKLSELAGRERIIWLFDPLILSDDLCVNTLLSRIETIGEEIHPYTEKIVFSFIDLYNSVRRNLDRTGLEGIREFSIDEMKEFASGLQAMVRRWGISASACAEEIDLSGYGIGRSLCIDPGLIKKISPCDPVLLRYLEKNPGKDPGQRPLCRCIKSMDIGQYNTCMHLCSYCYANRYPAQVKRNYEVHRGRPCGEAVTGEKIGGNWYLEDEYNI